MWCLKICYSNKAELILFYEGAINYFITHVKCYNVRTKKNKKYFVKIRNN